MTDTEKNPAAPRNLTTREIVLTSIGAQCKKCGYCGHLAPLVIRAEGLTQNRKTTNYAQYWLAVMGLSVSNPSAIEILCRNCLAVEQEEQKTVGAKPTNETVYVYSTDLLFDQINKRQQWLDSLVEPKRVYIITGDNEVYQYKGNNKKGSEWKVTPIAKQATEGALEQLFGNTDLGDALAANGLFKIIDNKLEPVS